MSQFGGLASNEQLTLKGYLKGHTNWVTQIATNPQYPDTLFSASRDNSLICWSLNRDDTTGSYGVARKRLVGHNNFISDVAISSDGQFALTSSWDKVLRLWDLNAGKTTKKFLGHTGNVMSVAFSSDNRQIVSGSMDRSIKLWNTLGICKYTIQDDNHSDWVSCVRFSPNTATPLIVSCGWDKVVKVWNLSNCKLKTNHYGHRQYLNTVTVSPDGSLCASGGRDGQGMLWDLNEGRHLFTFSNHQPINSLVFSPNRYWLCAACGPSIKIWDLESKSQMEDLKPETVSGGRAPDVTCLAWSADGQTLFAGYTDNNIKVYQITQTTSHGFNA